jgi:TolB protein
MAVARGSLALFAVLGVSMGAFTGSGSGARPNASGKVALSIRLAGRWRVAVVSPDASGAPIPLRNPRNDDVTALSWSPDGQRIAYADYGPPGVLEGRIWVMNANGTHPRRIAVLDESPSALAWSPDGRWLAYSLDTPGIFLITSDGRIRRTVVRPNNYDEADSPSWLPDGRRLLFGESEGDAVDGFTNYVAVVNADGRGGHRVTAGSKADFFDPVASPDGRRIVFWRRRSDSDSAPGDVYVMNSDGTHTLRLARGETPTWSPDGKHIIFSAPSSAIWTMSIDGSNQHALWPHKGACDCGVFSWGAG